MFSFMFAALILLLNAGVLGYVGLVIYATVTKLKTRSLPLPKRVWEGVFFGPLVLVIVIVLLFLVGGPAMEEDYARAKEECGHEPIAANDPWLGTDKSARFGRQGIPGGSYHCTFSEAQAAGYPPDQFIKKQDFMDAGYTNPSKEDLDLVNEDRSPREVIQFP